MLFRGAVYDGFSDDYSVFPSGQFRELRQSLVTHIFTYQSLRNVPKNKQKNNERSSAPNRFRIRAAGVTLTTSAARYLIRSKKHFEMMGLLKITFVYEIRVVYDCGIKRLGGGGRVLINLMRVTRLRRRKQLFSINRVFQTIIIRKSRTRFEVGVKSTNRGRVSGPLIRKRRR